MTTYHKIQTVFLRDPETNHKTLLEGVFAKPEFEYLQNAQWTFDEKVDGTNIRVIWDGHDISFGGKTDAAQTPTDLIAALYKLFPDRTKFIEKFGGATETLNQPIEVCLYGEGYGAGIQKGGGLYRPDKSFVLFDVKVGHFWLSRDAVEDIASFFNLDTVPLVGVGTLHDMVSIVRDGFKSHWGDFVSEGVIARPLVPLTNRFGERIVTKLKHSDFTGTKEHSL